MTGARENIINRRGAPTHDPLALPGVQRAAIATALSVLGALAPVAFDRTLVSAEKAIHHNKSAESATRWTALDDALARMGPDAEITSILVALGHYAVSALAATEHGDMQEVKARLFYNHVYSPAPKGSLEDLAAHVAFTLVPEDTDNGGRHEREQRAARLITEWTRSGRVAVDELVLTSGFVTARLLASALSFNRPRFQEWVDDEYRLLTACGDRPPG